MRFDWQTEEEDWDKEPAEEPSNPAVSNNRKPILWAALVVIPVVILAGWSLSRLAKEQVDNAANNLSQELLTVYELLNQSALTEDFEVFESFLSRPDTYSRQLPLELFRNHYFLDRPFLNLYALDMPPNETPQVTFLPDLERAEVLARQPYALQNQESGSPVWLERLTLFRKEDGRWQLTRWPIDETFWGETQQESVGLLTAEFPTRDQLYGHRLAQDVSALLDSICSHQDINCPPNFRLKMILVPYGQSLLNMNDNYRALPLSSGYDAYRIFLPTPTLVGRPVDEAGYQLLRRGYAAWIAAVLVQHYSRIRPVTHEVTADFLNQWRLSPPPLPVLPGSLVEDVQEPPIPFPEQDILLICQGYSPPAWVSYSPAADRWRAIPPPPNSPALAQLLQQTGEHSRFAPEGQGSLIRRPFTIENTQSWRNYLWFGGLSNLLETAENPGLFLADPRQTSAADRLLFYPFDGEGAPYLADTAACLSGHCQLQPLAGIPLWSPAGTQSLLVVQNETERPQLYLGDAQGQPLHYLTDGHAPQWLDENAFLYVAEGGTGVYSARIDDAGNLAPSERLADIASFFAPQILEVRPQTPIITHLALHPAQQDWIVLSVFRTDIQQDNLLLLNRQTGRLSFGYSHSNLRFSLPFQFSDDGRFLTVAAFASDALSGGWQILVFDLEPVAREWRYNTDAAYFDWSDDSQWLLIAEENALRLIAPAYNYQRQIPHTSGCHTVGWQAPSTP